MLRNTRSITGDDSHPLKVFFEVLPSGRRFRLNAHLIDINLPMFQRLFVFAIQSLKCIFFIFLYIYIYIFFFNEFIYEACWVVLLLIILNFFFYVMFCVC